MLIANEETPLLNGSRYEAQAGTATRLRGEKWRVFGVVAGAGFLSVSTFWIYYIDWRSMLLILGGPSMVESFLRDFSLLLSATVGVLLASIYSTIHGKRKVLLWTTSSIILGSLLVSTSQNITWLLLGRIFQTLGTTPTWSVGIGILGDTFRREQRGRAIGGFIFVSMLGGVAAPHLSHLMKHLAPHLSVSTYDSWRLTQALLAIASSVLWLTLRQSTSLSRPAPLCLNIEGFSEDSLVEGLHEDSRPERMGGISEDESRLEERLERPHRGILNPFSPYGLLHLKDVLPLSFASGAPIYSATCRTSRPTLTRTAVIGNADWNLDGCGVIVLWMEVSSYSWPKHADKLVYRWYFPSLALGLGLGALLAGFATDYILIRRIQDLLRTSSHHGTSHPRTLNFESSFDRPDKRFFVSLPGAFLIAPPLVLVGFVLNFAMGGGGRGTGVGWALAPLEWALIPFGMNEVGVNGFGLRGIIFNWVLFMQEEGEGGGVGLNVNKWLVMGCLFLVGLGTYSTSVPVLTYFLEVVPQSRNVQIVAASDALQILVTGITFTILVVLASAFGTSVANVVGCGVVLMSPVLIFSVIRRRKMAEREAMVSEGEERGSGGSGTSQDGGAGSSGSANVSGSASGNGHL
ncbi:hypothetical protein CC1G_04949 [Coprinopsis cinerea okayama7|uniref:Major facilitator superfamily (MFS) profile domain-containing protein n=1 Tax=Coprinopsis cinerea (strain Okayama-7 / 130 / ATCC MYA-4618 / FGSC 9003) TaxID=240176 RepID=A8PFN6_COPC7|nr:hypothetical protein CC1G_04949 [Coprinopsis cinerea okayama7\|eukprot:XP_001841105.2 hypothetical protein CC1G_04949 [Coprinopsis cinerea okayama7\